jgi:hypothetical protein
LRRRAATPLYSCGTQLLTLAGTVEVSLHSMPSLHNMPSLHSRPPLQTKASLHRNP